MTEINIAFASFKTIWRLSCREEMVFYSSCCSENITPGSTSGENINNFKCFFLLKTHIIFERQPLHRSPNFVKN